MLLHYDAHPSYEYRHMLSRLQVAAPKLSPRKRREGLEILAGGYRQMVGRALHEDIRNKRVEVGTLLAALRPLKLGPATHMSRMQQWGQWNKKHASGGAFDTKVVATKAWVQLVKRGSFEKAARLLRESKPKAAWQTLQVYNPFLKYLLQN